MKAFPFLNPDGTFDNDSIENHIPVVMLCKGLEEGQARALVLKEAEWQQREYYRAQKEAAPKFPKKDGNVLKEMFALQYKECDSSWR